MQNKKYNLLLHPVFLVSVCLLFINDFYLKAQYHNWFTGKLSDFTGVFAFAVFLTAISNQPKNRVIFFVALFFTWWKSPLSDPFLLLLTDYMGIPASRICDYTDLWAFAVLPFTYLIHPVRFTKERISGFAVKVSAVIAFFIFCATSMSYPELYYKPERQNEIKFYETFYSSLNEEEILNRLGANKTGYKKDSVRYYRIKEDLDLYYRLGAPDDSLAQLIPILPGRIDSVLYIKVKKRIFTLPLYVLNGDSLLNIQIEINQSGSKNKSTMIKIESFQTKNPSQYGDFQYGRLGKSYKKHFRNLFKK